MDEEIAQILSRHYDQTYQPLLKKRLRLRMQPDPAVIVGAKYAKAGHALDIGCGLGGNSIFLARNGFQVRAVDLSPIAIADIQRRAKREKLKVQAERLNILHALFSEQFKIVVSCYLFDHFTRDKAHWLVTRMQEKTSPRGVNVIVTFGYGTRVHPQEGYPRHFFHQDELQERYSGWKIIQNTVTKTNRMDFPSSPVITFIAQRLSRSH